MKHRAARTLLIPLGTLLGPLAACSGGATTPVVQNTGAVALELVVTGLTAPVHVAAPPGDARLFIVEQAGRIRIVRAGQLDPVPFLDISDRVGSGGERGLLSVAFAPDFTNSGHFFVDYTDRSGNTRVARFAVGGNPDRALPESETVFLTVVQPFSNHNGGQLAFGPDGFLYIGLGDGGGAEIHSEPGRT